MRSEILADFAVLSGVGIRVIDNNGDEQFVSGCFARYREAMDFLASATGTEGQKRESLLRSCILASRYGGHYIFQNSIGLTFAASCIQQKGRPHLYVVAGPVITVRREDYLDFEILPRIQQRDFSKARDMVARIPCLDSQHAAALAAQLRLNTMFINDSFFTTQSHIDDMVNARVMTEFGIDDEADLEAKLGFCDPDSYSIRRSLFQNKEQAGSHHKLISTLSKHQAYQARLLMNEVLEQTLFHANSNIDFVKARIPEYLTILFERAIQSGADYQLLASLRDDARDRLDHLEGMEDIISWLNDVNNRFEKCVLANPDSKNAMLIILATEYIRNHHAERITLGDVASHVHISPTYLSKLMKAETGQSFKSYLNRIRIEHSKQLMGECKNSIADVCYQVGFEDQSYFTKVFRQYVGSSPNTYRRSLSAAHA